MRDRLRGYRITCLTSGVLGFFAGVAARSELQRRLNGGRRLLPDDPHLYAPARHWPGSCWCGRPYDHQVHKGRTGR